MIHIDCIAMYKHEVRVQRGFPYPNCRECKLAAQFFEIDEYKPDGQHSELIPDMGIPEVRRKALEGDRSWWMDMYDYKMPGG